MTINVIATGSAGNLYELIDSAGNSILIESGMPISVYMKNKIGTIPPEMCLISHLHSDHAKYSNEYASVMPVRISTHENKSANFKALGYDLKHVDGTCTTFIIQSRVENKFLFFGTDIEFSKDYVDLFSMLRLLQIDNYLIECNYNDYLFHLATTDQRTGCIRHFSDNDVVSFMRIVKPKNPKIILIHGSNRLSADTYTQKYISSKIKNSTVKVAVGAKNGVKNLFNI